MNQGEESLMGSSKNSENSTSSREYRIKVMKNGPYVVTGGVRLTRQSILCDSDGNGHAWREDETLPSPHVYSLCRCGQSKNKPFCDGTHVEVDFDGTEAAAREPYLDQAERIHGPCLDLTDAPPLCAEARFCQPAGGIWDLTRRSDDPEARRIAIREAANCPSGRLVVWDKDGRLIEPELQPSIVLVEDPQEGASGPIWVRGGIPIESADGTVYEIRNRVTLCRCGKSVRKPFCDGRHLKS